MGVSSEIGGLLAVGMAREMAPLLTATLMTGKLQPLCCATWHYESHRTN